MKCFDVAWNKLGEKSARKNLKDWFLRQWAHQRPIRAPTGALGAIRRGHGNSTERTRSFGARPGLLTHIWHAERTSSVDKVHQACAWPHLACIWPLSRATGPVAACIWSSHSALSARAGCLDAVASAQICRIRPLRSESNFHRTRRFLHVPNALK